MTGVRRKHLTQILADYLHAEDAAGEEAMLELVGWGAAEAVQGEIIYDYVDSMLVIIQCEPKGAPLVTQDVCDAYHLFCTDGIAVAFEGGWVVGGADCKLLLVPMPDGKLEVLYEGSCIDVAIEWLIGPIRADALEVEAWPSSGHEYNRAYLNSHFPHLGGN
jgi:hypothetical protein